MLRGKKFKLREQKKSSIAVLPIDIHNKFEIEVIDSKTGEVKQSVKCFNTICNNLWKYLSFDKTSYANYIHFGDGSGNPAPDDTSLFSFIGYKSINSSGYNIDYENGIFSQQYSIQIPENEQVGKYITEVGIGYSTSSDTLCTHAMLQDMNGNPISIQKTETDVINIYSTVYVHFNPHGYDNGHIFLFLGSSRGNSILGKLAGMSTNYYLTNYVRYYTGGGGYQAKNESSAKASVQATFEVDVENKALVIVANRLASTDGNDTAGSMNGGGIGGIGLFGSYSSYGSTGTYNRGLYILSSGDSMPYYSRIIGEAIGTGDGVTKDFYLKFPFPRSAKIYVNGVQTSNVTVDYAPNDTNFRSYVHFLMPHSTPDKHVIDARPETNVTEFIFYNPMFSLGLYQKPLQMPYRQSMLQVLPTMFHQKLHLL